MTDAVAPAEDSFPSGTPDERELYLRWLHYLRGAVMRKLVGLSEEQARWTPDDRLLSLLGIVTHLTRVEWRWIDGGMRGQEVSRSAEEFRPRAARRNRGGRRRSSRPRGCRLAAGRPPAGLI